MEKDVIEVIETSEPANDDYNKDLCVSVVLDDTGRGGDGDERPVITRFRTYRYRYRQQQKLTSDGKGSCRGDRDRRINKQ